MRQSCDKMGLGDRGVPRGSQAWGNRETLSPARCKSSTNTQGRLSSDFLTCLHICTNTHNMHTHTQIHSLRQRTVINSQGKEGS